MPKKMNIAEAAPRFDPETIRSLFNEMAGTYGLVSLVTSFGFAAMWRHQVVKNLPACKPERVVDLMSGMGELWRSVSRHLPTATHVTAVDISPEMARRANTNHPFLVEMCVEDVLTWNCQPEFADAVISSFGLKTFDSEQMAILAKRMWRLLRPGGAFSLVEISVPPYRILRAPYMFYLRRVIPLLGRMFLGNPDNYRMLGIYTETFGNCDHFALCLENAGFEVQRVSYFFGCATGVRGSKRAIS